jgi:hypothetical protein
MTSEELYELAGRLDMMARYEQDGYRRRTLSNAAEELRDKADNKKAPAALER